jgi:hypothetical protein
MEYEIRRFRPPASARFANRHRKQNAIRTKGEFGGVNKQLELTRVSGYGLDRLFIRCLQRTH